MKKRQHKREKEWSKSNIICTFLFNPPPQSQQPCRVWGWTTTAAQIVCRPPGFHLKGVWTSTWWPCQLRDRPPRSAACPPTSPRWSLRVWPPVAATSCVSGPQLGDRAQRPGSAGGQVQVSVCTRSKCWVSSDLFNKSSPSCPVSVPDRVSALSMSPLGDGRTLRVSWSPPRGDWENYSVLLRNGSAVLVNHTISKLSRQHTFSIPSLGLVPGRVYGAEVTVHSGILGNTAHCHGRLGQFTFTPFVIWVESVTEKVGLLSDLWPFSYFKEKKYKVQIVFKLIRKENRKYVLLIILFVYPPFSPSSCPAAGRPSRWWNHPERPVESTGRRLGRLHCGPQTGGPRHRRVSEDPPLGGQRVHLQHPHLRTPVHCHRDDQQRQPDQLRLCDRTDRCVWFIII